MINILFAIRGLEEVKSNEFIKRLRELEIDVGNVYFAYSKLGVIQTCKENPEINVAIIQQYLEESTPYTPADYNEVDEIRHDLTIIPLISNDFEGNRYVKELYMNAIYNAIYDDKSNQGVSIETIGTIIQHQRDKKQARKYYNINLYEKQGRAVNPHDIDNVISYLTSDKIKENLLKRLEIVTERCTETELIDILNSLPEEYITLIKDDDKYKIYFHQNDVPEKKENVTISIPNIELPTVTKPSILSSGAEKITYVENKKQLIAVIGLSENAGSSFVSLNLAKAISETSAASVYVQPPNTSDDIFEKYNFQEIFGYGYIHHMNTLIKNGFLPEEKNLYKGVSFIVPDKSHDQLDKWTFTKMVSMVSTVEGTPIIDFGCNYDISSNRGVIRMCQQIIAVIDAKKELNVSAIQEIKKMINNSQKLIFIINNYTPDIDKENIVKILGDSYPLLFIDEITSVKKTNNIFLYPMVLKDNFENLAELCGYKQIKNVKKIPRHPKKITEKVLVKSGVVEIGFMGIERGAGTTHQALMCAQTLAYDFKTAFLEYNESCHIENLGNWLENKEKTSVNNCMFAFQGVDYYFGMSYMDFAVDFKDNYDYVVIDYGSFEENPDIIEEFIRTSKKMVIGSGSIWKRKEIEMFVENNSHLDPNHSFYYLFPFMENSELDGIRKICKENEVIGIPLNKKVLHPSIEVTYLFKSILNLDFYKNNRSKATTRKPLLKWLRKKERNNK